MLKNKSKIKFYSELLKRAHGEKNYTLKAVLYGNRVQYAYFMLFAMAGLCLIIFGLNLLSMTSTVVGVTIFSFAIGVLTSQFCNDVLACRGLVLIDSVLSEEKIESKIEALKND